MKILQVIIYGSLLIFNSRGEDVEPSVSAMGLNVKGMILKYGYPYKSYTVQTDDGYLLKLQRIPYGRNHTKHLSNRIPILLMPGLFCDSAVYANMGRKSLSFTLADNGYDVWLLNHRGSTLSKRHVTLNPETDGKKFWNFSFQEMGLYDVPNSIDRVLKTTKQKSLHFVGHSQGATAYFAAMSDKPEYAKKVRSVVTLAPAITMKYMTSPITSAITSFEYYTKTYAEAYQDFELLPRSETLGKAVSNLCGPGSPLHISCAEVILLIAGWTPSQFHKERIPIIVANTPSGASVKEVQHFIQLKNGLFHKFDYGAEENKKRYGQEIAPQYNLTCATPPVAIFHGDADWLAPLEEIKYIESLLPNVIESTLYPGFNHLDVIWGRDAPKLVFKDVLKFLRRYS